MTTKLCPRCEIEEYTPYGVKHKPDAPLPPALSRMDNETYICSACGEREAFRDLEGRPPVPPSEWPLDADELASEVALFDDTSAGACVLPSDAENVALYDDTTGQVIGGPLFASRDEAVEFVEWAGQNLLGAASETYPPAQMLVKLVEDWQRSRGDNVTQLRRRR